MIGEETLLTGGFQTYDSIDSIDQNKEFTYFTELKLLLRGSAPLVITFVLQYFTSITSTISAGKLGATELAAYSLGISTFNVAGLAIFQGIVTSLDTLCSQAYGSGNLHGVGLYFQRCSLILLVSMIPLAAFWWNSGLLLGYFIDDHTLVNMSQTFLRWHIIGVPGLIFFESGKRFLQAQHIFHAGTYVLGIMVPVNLILNWTLVWNKSTSLGFIGIPIVIAITYWSMSLLLLAYVVYINGMECWGGLSKQALGNWQAVLKLAIPGVFMVIAEFIAFEIQIFLAAKFGTEAIAAQSIVSNLAAFLFQIPFAYSVVISTRVGHYIGLGNIKGAKTDCKVFFTSAPFIGLFNFSVFYFGRFALTRIFTSDESIVCIATWLNILAGINQIADAFNVLGAGVLRGQGRQKIGSVLNSIAFYGIAIPLGYTLAFKLDLGLYGLWYGLVLGVVFLAAGECIAIYTSDWGAIIAVSQKLHGGV
ncbi:hypothetical protein CORT_0D00230 [Candida orthopsilosis Co 90-125]|uniref:MATE efflux family protein n=1 Tax=Candida orthopsilosis (strain 90-125) TaxID=1136231 RepID=H8X5V8_CANO9|nr:hypothetical protein CORT_0D00230 [Candida orthopsilosis Co 90-125]CCG22872.1 hypothetical protein CORT_0D00230 [Candida orthopsilosis Co 90-125]